MKKFLILLFFPFLISTLTSCSDSTSAIEEEEEEKIDDKLADIEPGTGAYSLSGAINKDVTGIAGFYHMMFDGVMIFTIFITEESDDYFDLEFTISYVGDTLPEAGTYKVGQLTGDPDYAYGFLQSLVDESILYCTDWVESGNSSGTLVITEITQESIKGTFEFEAKFSNEVGSTESLKFTNGLFHAKIWD